MRVCRRQQQDYKNQQRPFALFLSSQLTGVAPSISTSSTLFPFFLSSRCQSYTLDRRASPTTVN